MTSSQIDNQPLYDRFHQSEELDLRRRADRDRLANKAAHKALNIQMDQEDEMQINTNQTTNGLGWKELVAVGLLAIGAGAAYPIASYLLSPVTESIPEANELVDTNSFFDMEFTEPKTNVK